MKKVLYTLAAFSFVFVACNKQEIVPEEGTSQEGELTTVTIKASNGDADTKAAISDGLAFTWTDGDQIAVHTDAGRFYTSEALTTGGTTADFTVSLSGNRNGYAVYPASVAKSWDGTDLTLTLPATYTYAQVSGDNTPLPMIADNISEALSFYHVTGLFRVTVKAIPSDATGLVFQFPGNKVNGDFTISSPTAGTSTITTSAPDGDEDKITVTFEAGTATEMTLNIPLPTGTYDDVFITPVGGDTKVAAVRHIDAGGYTAARAHGKKLTATLVSFTINDIGDKVIFAPGNLEAMVSIPGTYTPIRVYINETYPDYEIKGTVFSATSWKFADNQFDYDSNSQLDGENTICDHFSWVGSGVTNEIVQNSYGLYTANSWRVHGAIGESESLYHDWGELPIESYASGFWRTPTGNENGDWDYILSSRSGSRFARGKINDISGLFIFPDTYSHPSDLNSFNNINNKRADFSSNQFTSSEWKRIESAGVIFLPAAGSRSDSNEEATTISGAGSAGAYWSSTAYNNAYSRYLRFTEDDTYPDSWYHRQDGRSVRLVRDL